MATISNFSSILEIAFAMNALVFFFELAPSSNGKLAKKYEEFQKLQKKKIELTNNREIFPLGFMIDSTYNVYFLLIGLAAIILAIISLLLLVYSAFYPAAEISSFTILILLVLFFVPVPVLFNIAYWKASKLIDEAIEGMEELVVEIEQTNARKDA